MLYFLFDYRKRRLFKKNMTEDNINIELTDENYMVKDENGEMIVEEFEKLGNPASHGCVRLRLEEAKWLYETLPLGVKVVIY